MFLDSVNMRIRNWDKGKRPFFIIGCYFNIKIIEELFYVNGTYQIIVAQKYSADDWLK